jgi:hypothetical protein
MSTVNLNTNTFESRRRESIAMLPINSHKVGSPERKFLDIPSSPTSAPQRRLSSFNPLTFKLNGPSTTSNNRSSFSSISSGDSSQIFGSRLAEKLDEIGQRNNFVGTPDYLAPESILGTGQGTSVDWVYFLITVVGCRCNTLRIFIWNTSFQCTDHCTSLSKHS